MTGELRDTFDMDPVRYDRARPRYPAELFDALGSAAPLRLGARILEIGPGTGQATLELARRGLDVTAVRLGPALAELLRQKLAAFAACEVVQSPLESFEPREAAFDLVFAATSWHWVEQPAGRDVTARALRQGGHLAIVSGHHVEGGTSRFFADVQDCYERWDPATPPGLSLSPASSIAPLCDSVDDDPRFGEPIFRRFERDLRYTTAEYLDVLQTFSGHIALDTPRRAGLLRCIAELIDGAYGGSIVKRQMWELKVVPFVGHSAARA